MTKEELNRVLDLQNKAYNLLLWIDDQARHQPDLLSDENVQMWKFVDTCELWVRRMIGIFPRELRPSENEVAAVARLFSAFLTTSFRVDDVQAGDDFFDRRKWVSDKRKIKLVAGLSAIPKTAGQKTKMRESKRHLQLIALEELAIENDCDLSRAQLETLARKAEIADALNIYSYAHELVRRSQFASQGAAVHSLWNSMDKKTRQKLNVEAIWSARETLLDAIKTATK